MKKIIADFFKKHYVSLLFLIIPLAVTIITGIQFWKFRTTEAVFVQGPGVVEIQKLSDYYDVLEGTAADSDIYVLGTKNPDEPSILLLGGIHANEPAGQVATDVIMENIEVTTGTVYIIIETNKSAYTHSFPQEATPFYYSIETPFGEREFKYGARATNSVDQWPIPDIYIHQSTGQKLSGVDTRNLNRAFPGKSNGTFTEKVAQAIVNLINTNDIILTLDFHEAAPEYGVNNALIYHERVRDTGISALMMMSLEMFWVFEDTRFAPIKPEASPVNLRGLTHR
jgi:predicted deacylase